MIWREVNSVTGTPIVHPITLTNRVGHWVSPSFPFVTVLQGFRVHPSQRLTEAAGDKNTNLYVLNVIFCLTSQN